MVARSLHFGKRTWSVATVLYKINGMVKVLSISQTKNSRCAVRPGEWVYDILPFALKFIVSKKSWNVYVKFRNVHNLQCLPHVSESLPPYPWSSLMGSLTCSPLFLTGYYMYTVLLPVHICITDRDGIHWASMHLLLLCLHRLSWYIYTYMFNQQREFGRQLYCLLMKVAGYFTHSIYVCAVLYYVYSHYCAHFR